MTVLRKFLVPAIAAGIMGATPTAQAADNGALLKTLDATEFWLAEDYDRRDALRSRIEKDGAVGLFHSDRLVHLDAESLAEDGIIDALLEIGPHLRARGVSLLSLAVIESDGETYVVEVNGTQYTVYTPEEAGDGWGLATETLFRIVNDLIPDRSGDRFYAIYGGNDLSGFFLPPEVVPYFAEAGIDDTGLPYTPTREAPWFGMPHS